MCRSLKKCYFLVILVVVFVSGCATAPYDYSALEESKPRSIVVIPPNNDSLDVDAPYIYLSTLSRPLAEKGYYVFPVSVIDHFLKENGLPTPAEMNNIPLDKIGEHIGADAVLYVSIVDWGQKFKIISSVTRVQAHLRLVDVKTGALLWESVAEAEKGSSDGGGGLAGAILGAIVTQVLSSAIDETPGVARQANGLAIYHQTRGLLDGPYRQAGTPEAYKN